jgi:hypothetical protein
VEQLARHLNEKINPEVCILARNNSFDTGFDRCIYEQPLARHSQTGYCGYQGVLAFQCCCKRFEICIIDFRNLNFWRKLVTARLASQHSDFEETRLEELFENCWSQISRRLRQSVRNLNMAIGEHSHLPRQPS